MSRNWNTTGLYKAQKDRMPAKRSRRIKASPPKAKLVPANDTGPICQKCGYGLFSSIHMIECEGW